jgi:hypothetical protein
MRSEERLDLHLAETVLPDSDIGGDTVLTVVEEGDPIEDLFSILT